MGSTSRERSRSRSAERHSRSHQRSSRHHERREANSRSRSRSRSGSRHRHHRHKRSSRSRSGDRHRHHHHTKHSRRSPHRLGDSSSSKHATVKKEVDDTSSAPAAAASVISRAMKPESYVKPERAAAADHYAAGASSAARPAGAAAASDGLKFENEPSEADIISALTATAAAAAAPPPSALSATAPSAAPAVVPVSQQQISYAPSGLLTAAANTVNGVEMKYAEPVDAHMPNKQWRLYVFKGKEALDEPLRIHRQSMYLIGRDEKVCDLPIAHPSASKQHAVIQFRQREVTDAEGNSKVVIKPYLMDLGSTNGTWLAGIKREPRKYYEMLENDLIKFGFSTREYVLINSSK